MRKRVTMGRRAVKLLPNSFKPFIPLAYLTMLWTGQGISVTAYLAHTAHLSRLGVPMHCLVILAIEILCLSPFLLVPRWAFSLARTSSASVSNAMPLRRGLLALTLASVHLSLLLFYVVLIGGVRAWRVEPNWEVISMYVWQVNTLLRQFGVNPAILLMLGALLWSLTFWIYHRVGSALLRPIRLELVHPVRLNVLTSTETKVRAQLWKLMLIPFVLIAGLYLVTRKYWAAREPLHVFSTEAGYLVMIPEGMLNGDSSAKPANVPVYPLNHAPLTPRNLILITVDALRSDQMAVYGASDQDTPYLSHLFSQGKLQRIESAYSTCTLSFCGILSILSSSYWHQLSTSSLSVADVLGHYGYQTRFLLSGDHTHFYGLKHFYSSHPDEYRDGSFAGRGEMNDDRILLPWIKNIDWSSNRPTFLDIHLMSVHILGPRQPQFERWQPYQLTAASIVTHAPQPIAYRNNYRNGILQADDMIRQIFEILESKGVLDKSLVIITADHGEYLGEFGMTGHGGKPYEPVVRIPLLIYDQSGATYPARSLTSQVDIAPTLVYAIGAPIPAAWSGIPLQLPTSRNSICVASHEVSGIVAQIGASRYKYLQSRSDKAEELFRLDVPGGEFTNLISENPNGNINYQDGNQALPVLNQMRTMFDQVTMQPVTISKP